MGITVLFRERAENCLLAGIHKAKKAHNLHSFLFSSKYRARVGKRVFEKMAQLPLPKANINTYFSLREKRWLRGGVGGQFPRNGVRVRVPGAKCELNFRSSPITHVRYSKILTWLRGAPRLPGHFFFLIWLGVLCAQVSFENCETIEWLFLQKVPNSNLHLYVFLHEYHLILPTVPPPQACTGRKQPRTYKTSPQATCYLSRVGEQTSKLLPYQHTTGFLNKA